MRKNGSVTVEAALTVPFIFVVWASFLFFFEILGTVFSIQKVLEEQAGLYAIAGYVNDHPIEEDSLEDNDWIRKLYDLGEKIGDERQLPVVTFAAITAKLTPEKLAKSHILHGFAGILVKLGPLSGQETTIDLVVEYEIRLPVFQGIASGFPIRQRVVRKRWQGENPNAVMEKAVKNFVYVTRYGSVYHLYGDCQYLYHDLSWVALDSVEELRSRDGSKYYPCQYCIRGHVCQMVYLTPYGNRYHNTRSCPGLIRYIETMERALCSRPLCKACAKREQEERKNT